MGYTFTSVSHALGTATGSNKCHSLSEYYDAWQWLSDHKVELSEADAALMDKLICDGVIITEENKEELGGIPYRGISAMGIAQLPDESI